MSDTIGTEVPDDLTTHAPVAVELAKPPVEGDLSGQEVPVESETENKYVKPESAFTTNQAGLAFAAPAASSTVAAQKAKMAYDFLDKKFATHPGIQNYINSQIGSDFNLPAKELSKLTGMPVETQSQAQQAIAKISGQPGIDLSGYKKGPKYYFKKHGELPLHLGVAGYDVGRGLHDDFTVGSAADLAAGTAAAAAPFLPKKVGPIPVRAIATGLGAIPAVRGAAESAYNYFDGKAEGGLVQSFAGGGAAKLAAPLMMGALSIPEIAEAAQHFKKGNVGEGMATAADVASNFLPPPLMALYMGLSPSELGSNDVLTQPKEMYQEGDTNVLKGSRLPRYAPGGGVIKKFAEAFEPIVKSGAQLKREAEYAHDVIPTHTFSDPSKLSIQDLQGGVLVGVPGDRTLAGHSLMSVNGVPLSAPVELHGGPRYGQRKADLGEDAFWASQYGAASTLQNKAARAAEAAKGNPVFGMYAAMAPDASNYALHHTEALLNQLDALSPNKAKLRAFDSMIRDKYPEFLGMGHPEVMDQFATNSDLRKHVAERLNKSTVANEYGLPSGEATIHAITEPALRNVKTGTTGYSVGELSPFAELKPELEHPTYDTQIPGKFKGQMIAQLPWEYYFPDVAKKIAQNPAQAPHAWGTFKMGDFNQPVTQELVDKIAPIEEMVKSAKEDFGKAAGGSVQHFETGGLAVAKAALKMAEPLVNRLEMGYKDVTKRIPELQESAKRILEGNGSREEHEALVNLHKPVTPYSFVPAPAGVDEARDAVGKKIVKNGVDLWQHTIPEGHPVGLRLDIPAYTNKGVWVNSIHNEGEKGLIPNTSYSNVSSVKNAMFGMPQDEMLGIAAGANKSPRAKITGNWNPVDQEQAVTSAQEYLSHPDWRQVGMDPERHGYFYDRETMEPITHAEEALQIGPLVLAKKPVYGNKEDFKYAAGGEVLKGGLALAKKVLPLAEREANKAKFLESSAIKNRLYHGTTDDFSAFDPTTATKKTGNVTSHFGPFLSDSPEEASRYAQQWGTKGGNVMPVYAQLQNPYIMPYKEMDKYAMGAWNRRMAEPGYDPNSVVRVGDMDAQRKAAEAYEKHTAAAIQDVLNRKQELIDLGHDGIIANIGGKQEIIPFDPKKIKSAIGNEGTYDITNPDITKKRGGKIKKKKK